MANKTVDCLVGLQWGSEGKGKIAAYLSNEYNAMVRSGGSQAGHTFYDNGIKHVNRQIPCGVVNPNCLLYISANGLINLDVFSKELNKFSVYPNRLMVDNNAGVITQKHLDLEKKKKLKEKLASTLEGVGAAQAGKVMREDLLFDTYAIENPELYFFSDDTAKAINIQIKNNHSVLLEGTQGFGLCLNHGAYPFVTSRDVTVSALLNDAGIAPNYLNHTIGVMRTYPIRVGGNSGPTDSKEIDWEKVTWKSGSSRQLIEHTSVTGRIRRVFEQDFSILEKALMINHPTQIALMFIDYINHEDYGKTIFGDLSSQSKNYIHSLEKKLKVPITLIGTGPKEEHIIDIRDTSEKACPVLNSKEVFDEGCMFPKSFYGYDWGGGFVERFINRKMTDTKGNPWERKILTKNL